MQNDAGRLESAGFGIALASAISNGKRIELLRRRIPLELHAAAGAKSSLLSFWNALFLSSLLACAHTPVWEKKFLIRKKKPMRNYEDK